MRVNTLEAEMAVAGSILVDPDSYYRVAKFVNADSFQIGLYRQIFEAAANLARTGEAIDPVLIQEQIGVSGETLLDCMNKTPTSANDTLYAGIVSDHAKRRKLKEMAQSILDNTDTETDQLLADSFVDIEALTHSVATKTLSDTPELVETVLADMEERANGKPSFVSSGYKKLDRILGGGFAREGFYLIAARPGVGKTQFALNIADWIGNTLFVTLEMSPEQLTARRIAIQSLFPSNRILMGNDIEPATRERIAKNAKKLPPMVINKKDRMTVPDIAIAARSIKGLTAIFVDYIGLVEATEKFKSSYEAVSQISRDLKLLAKSMKIPIIALCQLNREVEGSKDKLPKLANLRDSGKLEQDADGVILLSRSDLIDPKTHTNEAEPVELRAEVAKNRHAGTGVAKFNFYLPTGKIAE